MPAIITRCLVALLLLASRLTASAQAPAWQSAQAVATATAAASSNSSAVTATAVDAAGNVYLAGTFSNSVVLGGTMLTSLGGIDVFVVKFNPISNQFVWAQRAGGAQNDNAAAIAVNGTSLYVAGHFDTSAQFGLSTLTSAGGRDVFVAKLIDAGTTGNFVWAQSAGGTRLEQASSLVVSGASIYVAGIFSNPQANFGAITLTSSGEFDVFVAKLTDAGNTGSFVWAQQAGGTDNEYATALAVSGTSVYMAGYFASSMADFGTTNLVNVGSLFSSDVFVAKLTDAGSTGSFAWAKRAGGKWGDYANALAVSGTSVYVAGSFYSLTGDFGTINLTNTNAGYSDVFVTRLTDAGSTGSFDWAQRAGGMGSELTYALALSGASVYVAGYFTSSTVDFGSTTLTNDGSTSTADAFVAKLIDMGSTGSFRWAQRAGGRGDDQVLALATNGTNVYAAGNFFSFVAEFGNINITDPNRGFNSYTGFLASLTDATLTATTAAAGPREPATLFPNPARRTATLRLPAGATPAPLTLTDALGRAVRRYPAPVGPEAALDLGGLPAGLYLLRGAGPAQRLMVE